MANGIWEFDRESREVGGACVGNESDPKSELALPPGIVEVGEGRTSLNLEVASFRSAFQMPAPQANAAELLERPAADAAE